MPVLQYHVLYCVEILDDYQVLDVIDWVEGYLAVYTNAGAKLEDSCLLLTQNYTKRISPLDAISLCVTYLYHLSHAYRTHTHIVWSHGCIQAQLCEYHLLQGAMCCVALWLLQRPDIMELSDGKWIPSQSYHL